MEHKLPSVLVDNGHARGRILFLTRLEGNPVIFLGGRERLAGSFATSAVTTADSYGAKYVIGNFFFVIFFFFFFFYCYFGDQIFVDAWELSEGTKIG